MHWCIYNFLESSLVKCIFLPRKANLILACRPNRSFTGCAFVLILFNQNGSGKNWEEFCQNFPAQELRRKSASGKVPRRARFEKAESLGQRHWTPAYLASKRTGLNCTVHYSRNIQYSSKKELRSVKTWRFMYPRTVASYWTDRAV